MKQKKYSLIISLLFFANSFCYTQTVTQTWATLAQVKTSPRAIARDASGNIYTANSGTNAISKITSSGIVTQAWAVLPIDANPSSIAIAASGNIYTANYSSHTVSRITSSGTVTQAWAVLPNGANAAYPVAIAIDGSGNVYTANSGTSTLSKITSSGTVTQFWASVAGGNPQSIAIDASGNVYTANYWSNTVSKITSSGTVTLEWAVLAGEAGPISIVIDASGNIYTANSNNSTVSKITSSGTVTQFWAAFLNNASPRSITKDASGNIYTANYSNNTVSKITSSGVVTQDWAVLANGASPVSIVIDASGNVYTANKGNNSISKITSSGAVTQQWAVLAGIASPSDIAIDGSGNVYTANYGNSTVSKITSTGTVTQAWAVLAGGANPRSIAIDVSGNVYATTSYSTISKITSSGIVTQDWAVLAGGANPYDIVIDGLGNVYTANFNNNTISKITPSGTLTQSWAYAVFANSAYPMAIALDGLGNIYAVGYNTNSISKITSSGTVTQAWVALANGTNPGSIIIDALGNVYTANAGINTISKIEQSSTLTWAGTTNTFWGTPSNWSGNIVPTSTDNVIIPAGTLNAPIVSSVQSVNSLTVNSTASLNLANTLQVAGTLTNNGSITGSGNLTLNGISAQTIAGTGTITNLTLNNSIGATITSGAGNTQNITGTLTPTLGTLTTNGNLVLKSTSITNTAMIGIVGGSISGNVTVERFIPAAQRSFRFLTPGVTTTSSIKANWQENQNNTSTLFANNSNTNAGYGTHITGSTTGLNGFDATATGGASMFTFSNNSGQAWSSISNTNSNVLSAGTAYRLLVRGSRAVNLTNNASIIDATTLRATGALKTGTVIFNSTGTGINVLTSPTISGTTNDYSFIGNPYWAPVDWNTLSKTNVSTTYYLWDPTKTGSNNRGGYVSFTTGSGASGGGAVNQYIQPGQGVFIKTTGVSPSITFTEANKAVNSNNLTTTFRTTNDIDGRLNINLYLEQNYAARKTADAAAIVFSNNFSKSIRDEDAEKFINPDENISIKLNEKLLGLNGIPLPKQQDTVWLNMQNMLGNKYKLEVTGEGFASSNLEAYLIDNYLNAKTAIKLNDYIAVDYSIDNAPSAASNRFAIVFEKARPILLNASLQIKLSPNPAVDILTISYEGLNEKEATTISIVDMNGRIVKTIEAGKVPSGSQRISIKNFCNGFYNMQLINGENRQTQSFIKQ